MLFRVPYYYLRLAGARNLKLRCAQKRAIVLTFDDGPSASLTPELVELLGSHDTKATFFILGSRAIMYPKMMDLLVASGHEIACHSFAHLNAWKVSSKAATGDICDGYQALRPWVSSSARYRPPHGKLTLATYRQLRRLGVQTCWWTHDSGDTWPKLPAIDGLVSNILNDSGAVVLMHDLDRGSVRNCFVIELTSRILEAVRHHGHSVMTLSELFDDEG